MNGLPYYKAYPRDFIEGTIGMPFEDKCAYRVVLDLIYMQAGKLPDDARYISGLLGCSIRKWKSIRLRLIEGGKIQASGEFLTNYRAVSELESLAKLQDKQRENASGPRKNNDLQKPPLNHTEPEPDIDTNVSIDMSIKPIEALDIWNEICVPVGLAKPRAKMPAKRAAALKARLKAEGVDGWRDACERLAGSSFCRGENGSGWKADIDFLASEANFAKVIEGKYETRQGNERFTNPKQANTQRHRGAFASALSERREGGGGNQDERPAIDAGPSRYAITNGS